MNKQIFVNLSAKDLAKSTDLAKALGFSINPQFSDEKATCVVVSEAIHFMLMTEDFFKSFALKEVCDTSKAMEAIVCLSCESRAEVDEIVAKGVAAGGTATAGPNDHGFMYGHGFLDLDGHAWEFMFMEAS
jgi:predicted lactoylglutathione lyase